MWSNSQVTIYIYTKNKYIINNWPPTHSKYIVFYNNIVKGGVTQMFEQTGTINKDVYFSLFLHK